MPLGSIFSWGHCDCVSTPPCIPGTLGNGYCQQVNVSAIVSPPHAAPAKYYINITNSYFVELNGPAQIW